MFGQGMIPPSSTNELQEWTLEKAGDKAGLTFD